MGECYNLWTSPISKSFKLGSCHFTNLFIWLDEMVCFMFQHQVAFFCVSILYLFNERGDWKATLATPYLLNINMGRDLELEVEVGGWGWLPIESLKMSRIKILHTGDTDRTGLFVLDLFAYHFFLRRGTNGLRFFIVYLQANFYFLLIF